MTIEQEVEMLRKQNKELKELAECRLRRKNVYKERAEHYLMEVTRLEFELEKLEDEAMERACQTNDD